MAQPTPGRPHRIVIVGGGAGGLELATRLGRRHGGKGDIEVVLVDRTRTHMWKPLLHAVAAGSLNIHEEQIDYLYQARWNSFEYCRGPMTGLDRAAREIVVGEVSFLSRSSCAPIMVSTSTAPARTANGSAHS